MRLLSPALFFVSCVAIAQQAGTPPKLEQVPDGPPVAGETQADSLQQPEITIRRGAEDIIKEYRVNGRLYMVQIIPDKGIPYFLVDTDGDGNLDAHYNDLDPNLAVPAWVILSW